MPLTVVKLWFLVLWFLSPQAELQEEEQQKQQAIDAMRDKKTGLERTVELKRDLQGKKQQELRSIRAELERLEGSSSRLQELESELAKAVSLCCDHTFLFSATCSDCTAPCVHLCRNESCRAPFRAPMWRS